INGRDAMLPSGGTLTLRVMSIAPPQTPATGPQRFVELMVRDTGSGMPQSVRQHIFDPFFTTKPKGKGTGLGLSTVLSIARQHGGDVEVVSEEGVGTTFRVHLPLSEEQGDAPMVEFAATPRTREVRRGLVLLVDDEEVFRNSARRLLEGLGYPVKTARDGIEAVQVFDLHKDMIEIVILDLVMPNMDGEAAYHALKKIDPSVRVLLSSGQTELGGVRELLAAGAHGFLQKPYDVRTLGDAISRVMFGTRKWH
ncbi:MAG: response regulator, partial [bacterium]